MGKQKDEFPFMNGQSKELTTGEVGVQIRRPTNECTEGGISNKRKTDNKWMDKMIDETTENERWESGQTKGWKS